MAYRTSQIDPDYRREPKTNCYCEVCQRDIKSPAKAKWIAWELDKLPEIIHPADLEAARDEIRPRRDTHHHFDVIQFGRVGPECARKIGAEWLMESPPADFLTGLMQVALLDCAHPVEAR